MAADGSITFSTALDNSSLEKDLKETEKLIDETKRKLEEKEGERNAIAEELKEAAAEVERLEAEMEELKRQIEETKAAGESGLMPEAEADAKVAELTAELEKQQTLYYDQVDKAHKIAQEYTKADEEVKQLTTDLDVAKQRASTIADNYAKSYTTAADRFNKSLTGMSNFFDGFMAKITKRLKKLFIFSFAFSALSSLKKYLMEAVKEDQNFQNASNGLRATLQGLAAPIIKVLIPALTTLVRIINVVLTTLAGLVDSIFHTNFMQSIQQAQAAMSAANSATEATDKETAATKRLAKAKKEATRWLAAFDELNIMNSNDSDSDSDTGTPMDTTGGEAAPTWAGVDVGKIDATLAEIMVILGAALLAVGAILAFSGINIPLGITLMAIGALMIYSAAAEQWDKLPEEMKAAIVTLLEIVGGALIVIGVILCLTGNIPLGIGFIVAGALLFATAIGLDWENLANNVDGALNELGLIIGGMIAIIGVILLATGNIPLGIAALVAGIAIFGVAAVNTPEGETPSRVQQLIDDVMAILGPALVVLGVILCASGIVPLGVAAIIGGIAVLGVTEITENDEAMQKVEEFMDKVFNFIKEHAKYVLAVGLILTAVGLWPLGLAAIAAGIWALVSPETFDFEWMKNKIKEIWDGIVQWFNTNVAPIFTAKWWEEKFKSIANGLIGALNSALTGVGDFINNVASGVSDILDFWGVSGWSFSLQMPQIPLLAQGAVIPPNRRFMAVLGDQTNGRNLEAPEGLLRQIVRDEAGNAQMVSLLAQILEAVQEGQIIQCDSYTLAKVVNQRNAVNGKIYGGVM